MSDVLGYLGLIVGPVGLAVGVIVALSNRQIRQERIDHLDGLVEVQQHEITALQQRCSKLEGQVDAAVGELGDRIGRSIAEAVITRLAEDPL